MDGIGNEGVRDAGRGADAGSGPDGSNDSGAAIPEGVLLAREDDGSLVLNLPIVRDRFLSLFLPLFGLAFIGAGLIVLSRDGDAVGFVPLGIGLLLGGVGAYLAKGRLEIRLGADRLEWSRLFLRRWKIHGVDRGQIASLGTQAGVRTNGRPTSWRLHYVQPEVPAETGAAVSAWRRRRLLPGFHPEPSILWLGSVLGKWAQAPFDKTLDRSVSND